MSAHLVSNSGSSMTAYSFGRRAHLTPKTSSRQSFGAISFFDLGLDDSFRQRGLQRLGGVEGELDSRARTWRQIRVDEV